jgi:hypothetical protein
MQPSSTCTCQKASIDTGKSLATPSPRATKAPTTKTSPKASTEEKSNLIALQDPVAGEEDPEPTPTPKASRKPTATPTPEPEPSEEPTPEPEPEVDPVVSLLQEVEAAQEKVNGFKAKVRTQEVSTDGTEKRTVELAFRRPALLAVHVLEATSETARGAYLLWDGGDSLQVKPTILPMAMTLKLTDEHVVSKNGWTLDDVSVTKIMNVLLDPAAEITQFEDEEVNGHPTAMLEVRSARSPKGVDHEVIGIDLETYLPTMRELWGASNNLRYKLSVDSMTPNAQKDADFKI